MPLLRIHPFSFVLMTVGALPACTSTPPPPTEPPQGQASIPTRRPGATHTRDAAREPGAAHTLDAAHEPSLTSTAHEPHSAREPGNAPPRGKARPDIVCSGGPAITTPLGSYCLHTESESWHQAKSQCETQYGGHLASLETIEENHALQHALGSPLGLSGPLYFGLVEPKEGQWQWLDGGPLRYTRWASGEPNNAGSREHCAEWRHTDGKWNDISCDRPRGFVCQPERSKLRRFRCERHLIGTKSQRLCVYDQPKLAYKDAMHHCDQRGGKLAGPMINSRILKQAGAMKTSARSLWIGLSDERREGDFQWVSGAPLSAERWRPGEPNNLGDEDCTEWHPGDGRWNDLPCQHRRAYLCEL